MRARLISAACALAALTTLAALALDAPIDAQEEDEEEQSRESELDAAWRMDTCTPVLAALSTALERASARAR